MAILTITYADGSSANWGLTEREADVSHFAIERLFGKPTLNRDIARKGITLAEKENRRIRHFSTKSNL